MGSPCALHRCLGVALQDDERTGGQALEIPVELQTSMGVSMDKCPVPVTYSSKRKKLPGEVCGCFDL